MADRRSLLRAEDLQPNLVDRVVSYFDPVKGLRRRQARAQAAVASRFMASGYHGGRTDRKALQEYDPFGGSADYDHLPQQSRLRARSRDLSRNSAGGAAVNGTVTSTVGTGLRLQSQVDAEYLGISEEQAEEWQTQAERIWRTHSNDLDIEGELGQAELQSLAFRAVLESGDVLAIRRFRERRGSLLATRIQLIESDRISNPLYKLDTARLRGGVEFDADGRIRAYHVSETHPGDLLYAAFPRDWKRVAAYGTKSGDRVAKLLFDKRRPGQRRGIPYLAPVIEDLKQMGRLTEAELMAAVVTSLFTVLIETEGDDQTGGLPSAPEGTAEQDLPSKEGDIFLGSGSVIDLLPGEKASFADPKRPNDAFEPFFKAIMMQVGMKLEIPYEVLVKQFQSSYSAARAALLEAWRFIRGRRHWLSTDFCDWEYELVISEAIARGLLVAPGFFDDRLTRQAYLGTTWIGDAPGQVDPLKEVKAARERVEGRLSTRAAETAQLTGGDFDQNVRQLGREQRMLDEAGVEASPRTATPDEDDDPDEQDRREREAAA